MGLTPRFLEAVGGCRSRLSGSLAESADSSGARDSIQSVGGSIKLGLGSIKLDLRSVGG